VKAPLFKSILLLMLGMFIGMYFLRCGNDSANSSGNGDAWTVSGTDIYYDLGNVGVGTNDPRNQLHVNGILRLQGLQGYTPANYWAIYHNASDVNDYGLVIKESSDARVRIMNGNVTIGESQPTEKLDVVWETGIDANIGRGTSDTDITFIALRSANGTKWYIYPDDAGTLQVTMSKP